jgi:hypothetical protein
VQHNQFPDATAHTRVPIVNHGFNVIAIDSVLRSYNKTYYIETIIHDTPGIKNFYILYGSLLVAKSGAIQVGEDIDELFPLRVFPFDEWISDDKTDGASIVRNGSASMALEKMPKILLFQLFSIDEHFYAYRQSIFNLDNLESDPFASPVRMYTNFSNAYGVFASFGIYTYEISVVNPIPVKVNSKK